MNHNPDENPPSEVSSREIYHRRPTALARYRHGGFNSLFPLEIQGLNYYLLGVNGELMENSHSKNSNDSHKLISMASYRKKKMRKRKPVVS